MDGVYEGVRVRPNSIADALVAMAWSRRQRAHRLEVALLAAAALGREDKEGGQRIADLYRQYLEVANPTHQAAPDKVAEDMKNWDAIVRQFKSETFNPMTM